MTHHKVGPGARLGPRPARGTQRFPAKFSAVRKVNIETAEFDEPRDHDGFRSNRARVGYTLGAERLGVSVWEIPPGEAAYPFHFHLTEEELLLVLAGAPSLRTPEGWSELAAGDLVSFPRGAEGAHQLVNRTDTPARFLSVSTSGAPDVVLYPDSGKLGAAERNPDGSGLKVFFRLDDQVDYWDGERRPA
jgi:uncharacterized cupin superfamily protein